MSYTTFQYAKPTIKQDGDRIEVSVSIKNTGSIAGKEVAEVYVAAPKGNLQKPAKELKAFGKTRILKPGESETLRMSFARTDLASFDESQSAWVVDPGTYTVKVGANVEDIRGTATIKVKGSIEPVNNVMAPQEKFNLLHQ